MRHTEKCLKRQKALEEFRQKWPKFCTHCNAWGVITIYPSRDDPGGTDPCGYCLEQGICPRCGDPNLNFLERGYNSWGYCHVCGWDEHAMAEVYGDWKSMFAPWDGDCDCWYEEEQDDQLELRADLDGMERELEEADWWNTNPIRFEDGAWWFYDELWADRYGPYEYESVARVMLDGYIQNCLGDGLNYYWAEPVALVQLPLLKHHLGITHWMRGAQKKDILCRVTWAV